jgi:hypothetical protein
MTSLTHQLQDILLLAESCSSTSKLLHRREGDSVGTRLNLTATCRAAYHSRVRILWARRVVSVVLQHRSARSVEGSSRRSSRRRSSRHALSLVAMRPTQAAPRHQPGTTCSACAHTPPSPNSMTIATPANICAMAERRRQCRRGLHRARRLRGGALPRGQLSRRRGLLRLYLLAGRLCRRPPLGAALTLSLPVRHRPPPPARGQPWQCGGGHLEVRSLSPLGLARGGDPPRD